MDAYHRAPPPAKWKKKRFTTNSPFWVGGTQWIIALFSSFPNWALLDERKLCVFFFPSFFFFLSFPKTKALSILLPVSQEKFKKGDRKGFRVRQGKEGTGTIGSRNLKLHLFGGDWIYVERRIKHD